MLADKKKMKAFYNTSSAYLNVLSDLSHYSREVSLKQTRILCTASPRKAATSLIWLRNRRHHSIFA